MMESFSSYNFSRVPNWFPYQQINPIPIQFSPSLIKLLFPRNNLFCASDLEWLACNQLFKGYSTLDTLAGYFKSPYICHVRL